MRLATFPIWRSAWKNSRLEAKLCRDQHEHDAPIKRHPAAICSAGVGFLEPDVPCPSFATSKAESICEGVEGVNRKACLPCSARARARPTSG